MDDVLTLQICTFVENDSSPVAPSGARGWQDLAMFHLAKEPLKQFGEAHSARKPLGAVSAE